MALDLVTTSALLDLVVGALAGRLAVETLARSIPFYAALIMTAASRSRPHALDAKIVAAVNKHQRGNKGFGRRSDLGGEACIAI